MNLLRLLSGTRATAGRWSLVGLALVMGCAKLDPIPTGVCGNHIVEAGEDCDGSASSVPAEKGKTFACAPPSDPAACHFVKTTDAVCPMSMRAGADGVCRSPAGGFKELGKPIAPTAGRDPVAVDLDNDGNLDVVLDTDDEAFVELLDKGAARTSTQIPKSPGASFVFGDFMGAGKRDLLLPVGKSSSKAFDVFAAPNDVLGTTTYSPVALSSNDAAGFFRVVGLETTTYGHPDLDDVGLLIDCNPTLDASGMPSVSPICQGYHDSGLALFRLTGGMPVEVFKDSDIRSASNPPLDPHPLKFLVTSKRAHTSPSASSDDIILAFRGTSYVRDLPVSGEVLCDVSSCSASLCVGPNATCPRGCAAGCIQAPKRGPLDMALKGTTDCSSPTIENALVVDANGDGLADVLVSARCASSSGAVFEFDGNADWTKAYAVQTELGTLGGNGGDCTAKNQPAGAAKHVPTLLAAGDVDRDGKLDYVFDGGVSLSSSTKLKPPEALDAKPTIPVQAGDCYSHAEIADVNGDGKVDVIATGPHFSGIDVLLANGTSFLTPVFLTAPDDVDMMTVGDFDGDSVNDIVVTMPPPAGKACVDPRKVLVYWGKALAPPSTAAEVGALPAITQMISARLYQGQDVLNGGLSDLGILSECSLEEATKEVGLMAAGQYVRHTAAVFGGSSDRSLTSPYVVRLPPQQQPAEILAMGLEEVVNTSTGEQDPLVVETNKNPDVLLLGRSEMGPLSSVLSVLLLPTTGNGVIAPLHAPDVITIAPSISDWDFKPSIAALPPAPATFNGRRDVFVAYVDASAIHLKQIMITDPHTPFDLGTVPLAVMSPRLRIVSSDFDRDGNLDIAVVAAPKDTSQPSGTIAIWYGKGSGMFAPPCTLTSPDSSGFRGLASVDTGGSADAPELTQAVATGHDVFLFRDPIVKCALGGKSTALLASAKIGPGTVVGVAAGDFDNDGLADIVIAQKSSIYIFTQGTLSLGGSTTNSTP